MAKKQWWPSNRGICLATGAGGGACWNPAEWLTEKETERRPFWILSSWGLRPKRECRPPRDQERGVGGRAATESADWETLQTQAGKNLLCQSSSVLKQRGPPTPPLSELMPQRDKFGKYTTFSALLFAKVQQDTCPHVLSSLNFLNSEIHIPQPHPIPRKRLQTYIHLKSIQRQIKQLTQSV